MLIAMEDKDFADLIAGDLPRDFRLPDSPVALTSVLEMLRTLASSIAADFVPAARMIVEDGETAAETSVDNTASQIVLTRNGFQEARQRTDKEEGPLIRWLVPTISGPKARVHTAKLTYTDAEKLLWHSETALGQAAA